MDRYSKIIEEKWKNEREKLKEEIKENGIPEWLELKIKKVVDRVFLDKKYEDKIRESLLTDDVLLSFLMKDPKRQNIYESVFKDELTKIGVNVQKLNPKGAEALYLLNDEIVHNSNDKPRELKSLDFVIHHNGKTIYVVNKYTNECGGAQDNQYNDVIIQLKNLGPNTVDSVWFCLDGQYYTESRIQALKDINENAIILDLDKLITKLQTNSIKKLRR
ncbi:hypothetical protein ACNF36_02465 [Mycoplasma sp. 4463]|uniref:hypothetical protein n=2 Tax=unclassified Mycoplasma TaxID=2683645 RepID=UPI003AADA530